MNAQATFVAPQFSSNGFNCPHCGAFADQHWGKPIVMASGIKYGSFESFWTCRCMRCQELSIWINKKMIFPSVLTSPLPNPDLPDDIKADYEEARAVLGASPRGAAALLRLSIQKLCKHLGEKGKNINDDIKSLVQKGLSPQIQQALDIVRVVGNDAVHPGQIDLNDNPEVANKLFGLVNIIAEVMITQPKHIASLYESVVPENKREEIKKRDGS